MTRILTPHLPSLLRMFPPFSDYKEGVESGASLPCSALDSLFGFRDLLNPPVPRFPLL